MQRRALTAALAEIGCGCFVPDLTRFTIPQCAGARQPALYSKEFVLQENKRRLQAQIIPDNVHFLLHIITHRDFGTPFPACFAIPFIGRINAHLAPETADR